MLSDNNINNLVMLAGAGAGLLSVILTLVSSAEYARGINVLEKKTVYFYTRMLFIVGLLLHVLLWITAPDTAEAIEKLTLWTAGAWGVTAVTDVLLSILSRAGEESKRLLRGIVVSSMIKVVLLALVSWLVAPLQ